jgi:hypothetical protein
MYTYSAFRPSSAGCIISPGGDTVTEAMTVMPQMFAGALTPAA